ncbi:MULTISPECIES: hypothetical protein [Pacificibacter]|uniref:hypothetical protein n=1 Tax=Pacificibacter TaxID=1042323 RepID=UPI001C082D8C|nr:MULTISPECIES: hypothetical protein [Pacificibacter]MBU2934589.1 hypothetical protein [Pacificibacter marinus]MDO6616967.1 hypothetical protein [Pacificibacter sp. 1_MG-2023]
MIKPIDFTSDCANCAALCCLSLAFDQGDSFAHDKTAGTPCHNLSGFDCAIHKDLTSQGYSGCVAYQCLGAGQRVTALFDITWRDDPKMTAPMMDAFRQMRAVQSVLQLLEAASALPLPTLQEQERRLWLSQITPEHWTPRALETFEDEGIEAAIKIWLRGLAKFVPTT